MIWYYIIVLLFEQQPSTVSISTMWYVFVWNIEIKWRRMNSGRVSRTAVIKNQELIHFVILKYCQVMTIRLNMIWASVINVNWIVWVSQFVEFCFIIIWHLLLPRMYVALTFLYKLSPVLHEIWVQLIIQSYWLNYCHFAFNFIPFYLQNFLVYVYPTKY